MILKEQHVEKTKERQILNALNLLEQLRAITSEAEKSKSKESISAISYQIVKEKKFCLVECKQ